MSNYVALCAVGAEKILGNELRRMGCSIISRGGDAGRVLFTGDADTMYLANMALRTSDRVALCVADGIARDFDSLFELCRAVAWQDFFRKDVRVVVDKVRCHKSALRSERTVQSVIQKAIYTKLGDVWHMRVLPETGAEATVRVYLDSDEALILLDTTGEPLHKRGYRRQGGAAPLRETLAATCLLELLWKRKAPLRDLFCGSGTIALEALLYAHDIAPGIARDFAYKTLSIYSADTERKTRRELANRVRYDVSCDIMGSDIDPRAVHLSGENARRLCDVYGAALADAGAPGRIAIPRFIARDFRAARADCPSGCILSNPPYGERLGDEEAAEALYGEMSALRENFPGWEMGFLSCVKTFEERFGSAASVAKSLRAGNLDTTLYIYKPGADGRDEHGLARQSNNRAQRGTS